MPKYLIGATVEELRYATYVVEADTPEQAAELFDNSAYLDEIENEYRETETRIRDEDDEPKEISEAELTKLAQRPNIEDLRDIVTLAIPYMEDIEKDPAYKPGAVAKFVKRMRKAAGV